jgi:glutamate-5-semialdehyde dehydrogenase
VHTEYVSQLSSLTEGQPVIYGGNKVTHVPADLAATFVGGDHLVVVNDTGALLHIPAAEAELTAEAVGRAHKAFDLLAQVSDEAVSDFFHRFANHLETDQVFTPIAAANQADIVAAKAKGRSTTRLTLTPKMRADMIAGLRGWRDATTTRDSVVKTINHEGWQVDQLTAGLGVVGFVFEGRPNVFADACGVMRSGNSVVFRIGSDALGTAKAIAKHALNPALAEAGLPEGTASLVESPARSAGWALFNDDRLALAVARGSGGAVSQLGAVARQAGTPVSLHGTGGAWIVAGESADAGRLRAVVANSLDRKVCNTLNTCCVVASRAEELMAAVLAGVDDAGAGREVDGVPIDAKIHVAVGSEFAVPDSRFTTTVSVGRAGGVVSEMQAESIERDRLGEEWEWEESPELTLVVVDSVDEAVELFNVQSPRFAASLIAEDESEQSKFWKAVDAPFVGDGFTRWVDGQYALNAPELGLSNWQFGRLFSRGGVLSGDSVFTIRTRVTQPDPTVHR